LQDLSFTEFGQVTAIPLVPAGHVTIGDLRAGAAAQVKVIKGG